MSNRTIERIASLYADIYGLADVRLHSVYACSECGISAEMARLTCADCPATRDQHPFVWKHSEWRQFRVDSIEDAIDSGFVGRYAYLRIQGVFRGRRVGLARYIGLFGVGADARANERQLGLVYEALHAFRVRALREVA